MTELDRHLQAVLLATAEASKIPDANGQRRSLLHLRMGGGREGINHHAWPDDAPTPSREDLETLAERGLVAIDVRKNCRAFRPTAEGSQLAVRLQRASASGETQVMGVPGHRELLRWFHGLEDDAARSRALGDGWSLIQAALTDALIDEQDVDGFADRIEELVAQEHLACDNLIRLLRGNPIYELQQASNFRSTAKGRAWLSPTAAPSGPSFAFHESTVGQVAGGNISNFVSLGEVLDRAEAELERVDVREDEREAARTFFRSLRGHGADVATSAGGGLVARLIAVVLGLEPPS